MKFTFPIRPIFFILSCWLTGLVPLAVQAQPLFSDHSPAPGRTLHQATIFTGGSGLSNGEKTAATILSEEVEKRTGLKWEVSGTWPVQGDVIILRKSSVKESSGKKKSAKNSAGSGPAIDPASFAGLPALPSVPESFRIGAQTKEGRTIILVEGIDGRGVLFGAGKLLRIMQYNKGSINLAEGLALAESPDKPIRGHQLGYRNTANSYDGWTAAQFEQYIRELVIFGSNSIESIPIFDEKPSPHFKMPLAEMNMRMSEICQKYDIDYWMWIPAQFDLKDPAKRKRYIDTFENICKYSVRINGVFFPGGDPGDNPPEQVLPLLKDLGGILKKYHPEGSTWLSLQGYTPAQNKIVYAYIQKEKPTWLGGLISGPSSPNAEETRAALPANYRLRYYPDLTHNVRCEFPIPWWDPAFNLTLGRESVNPRPYHYSAIYKALQPYIDGFISYSDGVHDDVNKITWTRLAWDPNVSERETLKEYANFFFGSPVTDQGADGILALEKNWEGPIVANGGIVSTLQTWKDMEEKNPELSGNWRWQMYLLRAYYDAYSRSRFIYETQLEKEANEVMLQAVQTTIQPGTKPMLSPDQAMAKALSILQKTETEPVHPEWRQKVIDLCAALYQSISLQTSVKKYQASGEERGAVLDFIDRPLNNRWWIEDEFKKIGSLPETEKSKALETIARWENPGPGSSYDDVGNVSLSPHVLRGESWITDPLQRKGDYTPWFEWWQDGFSRKRLSWMTDMRWPLGMEYHGLDSTGKYEYTIRITGKGESLLKANGKRLSPTLYGKEIGEIKEFPVPAALIPHGKLLLTWDEIDEEKLNWRQQSRVAEVWLIRNQKK
ncbi:hypothetical protein ACX0G9_15005 [Flavitalea flava]